MDKIDISDLEKLYETFDKGHGPDHRDSVHAFAMKLAENRAKNKYLVELAAKLHDIGISRGREGHELFGYQMINEDPRFDTIGVYNKRILANAVREHRASTGNPKSIVGKIVSDADRASTWAVPFAPIRRAYDYGLAKYPELSMEDQLIRAKNHIIEKYAPEGTGRRLYFPESEKLINDSFGQISAADVATMKQALGL